MKFEFDTSGLDKLQKDLDQLANNADNLDGTHEVSFKDLFPSTFMRKYTDFQNIEEFTKQSNFDWKNIDDIPEEPLNSFTSEHTTFDNWSQMLTKASEEWSLRQLGL